jgi:hypothetical protein
VVIESIFLNNQNHNRALKNDVTRVQKTLQNQILYKIEESNIKVGKIGIEVQLDESKFGKINHNRGHHVESVRWGRKVKRTKIFAITVDNRMQKLQII